MDLLTFKEERHYSRRPGDIDRLVAVAADHDCVLAPTDACRVWEAYSETSAAGWLQMGPYSDADLWFVIEGHCSRRPLPECHRQFNGSQS